MELLRVTTLSSEATNNSYDDGAIGISYIGWIYDVTHKLQYPELILDEMINLPAINKEFENEKIEGICVESINDDEFVIHLVSDNDSGEANYSMLKWCCLYEDQEQIDNPISPSGASP